MVIIKVFDIVGVDLTNISLQKNVYMVTVIFVKTDVFNRHIIRL